MNTPQHRRAHSLDKQFPGCIGKMVNLFDLSAGLTSNNVLADHPHHLNGPTLSRSLSDMSMAPSSLLKIKGHVLIDKTSAFGLLGNLCPLSHMVCFQTVSHMRRSSFGQKSSGTPLKALIVEEMSKDVETKNVWSNVIAKLMGLESLPQKQQPHLSAQKSQSRAAELLDKDHVFLEKEVQNELLKFHECKGCVDFFEMLQHPNTLDMVRVHQAQEGRRSRSKHEKKMDLVRQKFVGAKRLVAAEKLCHSREFQDALEVLSANRELFLCFLQEQDSLFSGNLYELPSLSRETKHIAILRPSKVVDVDKLMKQPQLVLESDRLDVDDAEHVCSWQ